LVSLYSTIKMMHGPINIRFIVILCLWSVHRWPKLIIVQRDATQSSLFIILRVHSTCFGCQPHPSSGVHKTVTTASGTGHIFLRSYLQAWPRWREATVLCNPDDGCGWNPKHVERTCRIINRLLCVASRLTIINIDLIYVFCILLCNIIL